jgi:hypothetical protein
MMKLQSASSRSRLCPSRIYIRLTVGREYYVSDQYRRRSMKQLFPSLTFYSEVRLTFLIESIIDLYRNTSGSRGNVTACKSANITTRLSPLFCSSIHFLIAPIRMIRTKMHNSMSLTKVIANMWNTRRLNARQNATSEHLECPCIRSNMENCIS